MSSIIVRAKCHLWQPNYRIIKAQFDPAPLKEDFGEMIYTNLMRERGVLEDGAEYEIILRKKG